MADKERGSGACHSRDSASAGTVDWGSRNSESRFARIWLPRAVTTIEDSDSFALAMDSTNLSNSCLKRGGRCAP